MARPSAADPHRVVIVGGGFAGLNAARELGPDAGVDVTLVDRHNYHLFQPLLYQVATGALSPGEIAQPLRAILRRQRNTRVLLGEAVDLDPQRREVRLGDGGSAPYDSLIVACGSTHSYFGNDEWARHAPGLKTVDDATEVRRRIFVAFEAAEREARPDLRAAWMTFVIVGGGPTGVELAGALGEIANDTLRRDFRAIHPPDARIILVETDDRVLPPYPPEVSRAAERQLRRLGVDLRTSSRVVGVDGDGVEIESGGVRERVATHTVLWAAGVAATGFVRRVAERIGVEPDRAGRIAVGPYLHPAGREEILVVGDAAVMQSGGRPVPGVAQGAIQSGVHAARIIRARLDGEQPKPFRYRDRGEVAIIGRLAGVTNVPWLGPLGRQSGFPAWFLWLFIHILYLIGFANRIVVLVRWGWSFFTHGRGHRLITGENRLPEIDQPQPVDEPAQASPGVQRQEREESE
ncbi:MAG TPA: NAD(P)/FAD-dependent oxidoreductase [Candidatus Limnocylindria bacterium]|nr:NAD(P)/FAD-dependent oxidoreductase [Candidatus Limnocylindria bacterium]